MRFSGLFLLTLHLLTGCGSPPPANQVAVGTIAGPETELVEEARRVAHAHWGLDVKIIEFSDYNLPNAALQDGSLDANVYQHLPYLESAIKTHGYTLEVIGKTFVYPAALYSRKFNSLDALPEQALIALPNDPSNEARALRLLSQAGLITLKSTREATIKDIEENPKKFRFKELDAAQLPRILPDVDAAVINTTFANSAGLNPLRDALLIEDKNSPYANLIVINKSSTKREQLDLLVKALNSPEVRHKAQQLFGDAAIPAW